ncbi:SurA N-terminal domain-containing protein [Pelagibius marinus]|uniref:SurA N-terminal domain-containing protein n=1 Tax=Pelagibius marinus TaxID=2762760 RepID=UPI001872B4BC|nr:SurA N-terminal domain-containing protein [Pelagibius marinus]
MKARNLLIKIVTVILFSLLILSFAVWGIGDIFRGGGQAQVVAEVGETVIDQRDFSNELSREVANLNRRLGTQLSGQQVRAFGIPQQVLSQMISRAVLDEKARRMGLLITEQQMREQILENPAFQDGAGNFDRNRFATFLRQLGMSEQGYMAQVSDDTKRQQLVGAVVDGAAAPSSLAERVFIYREERRVADYVDIQQSSFEDLGTPEEAALQTVYDEASGRFMKPSYRSVSMVFLDLEEAASKIAVSDERLMEAFEARKDEFYQPERRSVSQAVLPDEAAAQALVDKLAEGGDFAAVVEEATGRAPVDLGEVTQEDLPEELSAAVFALDEGQASAPVQSVLGWHVLKVSSIEPAKEATLEEHRDALRKDIATAEAVDVLIGIANQFDEELANGSTMEQAAQFLNLDVREIPAIDDQGRNPDGETVENLPPLNDFLGALNALQAGEASTLKESSAGDFFMVRIDDVTPAEKKPLQDVREDVVELWQARERERLAREQGQAIVDRLKSGEDFAAVAEAEGLELQETQPVTRSESDAQRIPHPLVAQQLFEIAEGEAATFSIPGSQIVVQLKEILPPAEEGRDARLAQLEDQLTASLQDDIFQQFLVALQQDFDVTVNQRLVDAVVEGF